MAKHKSDQADELKPIVLTMTIFPPKKGVRKVVVTGAPDGEMPLMLTGVFAERHALIDQAFSGVLKREPQLVTLKEAKTSKSKSKGEAADDDDGQGVADEADEETSEASDQLVNQTAAAESGDAEPIMAVMQPAELPVIEGDTGNLHPSTAYFEQPQKIATGTLENINEVGTDGEQD